MLISDQCMPQSAILLFFLKRSLPEAACEFRPSGNRRGKITPVRDNEDVIVWRSVVQDSKEKMR
jgi:hypothetical protein